MPPLCRPLSWVLFPLVTCRDHRDVAESAFVDAEIRNRLLAHSMLLVFVVCGVWKDGKREKVLINVDASWRWWYADATYKYIRISRANLCRTVCSCRIEWLQRRLWHFLCWREFHVGHQKIIYIFSRLHVQLTWNMSRWCVHSNRMRRYQLAPDEHCAENDLQSLKIGAYCTTFMSVFRESTHVKEIVAYDDHWVAAFRPSFTWWDCFDARCRHW